MVAGIAEGGIVRLRPDMRRAFRHDGPAIAREASEIVIGQLVDGRNIHSGTRAPPVSGRPDGQARRCPERKKKAPEPAPHPFATSVSFRPALRLRPCAAISRHPFRMRPLEACGWRKPNGRESGHLVVLETLTN